MRLHHIAVGLVMMTGAAAADDRPADADINRLLVGKWTTCLTGGAAKKVDGTIDYAKDGTFVAAGKVKLGEGEVADVTVEGTWKVADGAVVETVTKSSHPGLAPVGATLKENVIAIDEKELRVKRGLGDERKRTRVEK